MSTSSLRLISCLFASVFIVNPLAAQVSDQTDLSELNRLAHIHPRLFIDPKKAEILRQEISGPRKELWERMVKEADAIVKETPPAYRTDPGEQLWQRQVGNKMATLAFAWLISRDRKYLDAASEWATASCHYETWGLVPDKNAKSELYQANSKPPVAENSSYETAKKGLAYGHQLLGLAMIYDYAYADLAPETRELIRKTIVARCNVQLPAFKERYALLQNHSWINSTGLLASGLALFDEEPAAADWIRLPMQILARSNAMLPPDGASQEGYGYWEYGTEYLLKMMDLGQLLGKKFEGTPWWKHTADYGIYLLVPRKAWTKQNLRVDFADCVRFAWYGPDYQLRALARMNHDGVAQWTAQQIDEAKVDEPISPWLNLLWYDPAVPPTPVSSKPTLHHFEDMGLVSARSDWSGDESLLVLRAGGPIGSNAQKNYSATLDPWDIGHVHRDASHFCLFGAGEWLIRNPGYAQRETSQHNTLTVSGHGQLGDAGTKVPWPLPADVEYAQAKRVRSSPGVDEMVCDAANSYPKNLGLKKFRRHFLFLKPDVLIVADDIDADQPTDLSLFLHPENPAAKVSESVLIATGAKSVLRLENLTPEGVTSQASVQTLSGAHAPKEPAFPQVVFSRHTQTWLNLTALSWSPSGQEPVHVTVTKSANVWTIHAGNRTAVLDWNAPVDR